MIKRWKIYWFFFKEGAKLIIKDKNENFFMRFLVFISSPFVIPYMIRKGSEIINEQDFFNKKVANSKLGLFVVFCHIIYKKRK